MTPEIYEALDPVAHLGNGADDLDVLQDWPLALGDVLGEALDDAYADAGPEDLDHALDNVLGSMSAPEAFNFAKALNQIGMGAQRALADPMVGQVVRTALPIAAGAAGTAIGGPAGTAIGAALGNAAVSALPGAPAARPRAPTPAPAARPAAAGGSAAAAQGLVLSQQPDVLKALLAAAMGQHGQKTVGGVPVAQILAMLSSVVGQAAADADELMYLDQERAYDSEAVFEAPDDGALYATLLEAESAELADTMEAS